MLSWEELDDGEEWGIESTGTPGQNTRYPLPGPKLPELEVPVGDSHEGPLNN
jgi:hypothetical protein